MIAPPLFQLEMVNVAARWGWDERALLELAPALHDLGFELKQPALESVARWTARGLTAYGAAYVALAEGEVIQLITDDNLILDMAAEVAVALSDIAT